MRRQTRRGPWRTHCEGLSGAGSPWRLDAGGQPECFVAAASAGRCTRATLAVARRRIAAGPAVAWAPDRPARILVGFAAGGTGDLIARTVAEMASPRLGQPVVVENRAGANGMIAAEAAARAAPDGLTMLMCPTGNMTILPELPGARLPLDVRAELAPVANVALSTYGMVVGAGRPGVARPSSSKRRGRGRAPCPSPASARAARSIWRASGCAARRGSSSCTSPTAARRSPPWT